MDSWKPPRGIRYSLRPDREGAPFFLHWREDGKRHAAAYDSLRAREKAAKALADKRSDHGADVLTFDPREWRVWLAFKKVVGDVDPLQVAHEWTAERRKNHVVSTITIGEASERYLKSRADDGLAKATLTHAKMDRAGPTLRLSLNVQSAAKFYPPFNSFFEPTNFGKFVVTRRKTHGNGTQLGGKQGGTATEIAPGEKKYLLLLHI